MIGGCIPGNLIDLEGRLQPEPARRPQEPTGRPGVRQATGSVNVGDRKSYCISTAPRTFRDPPAAFRPDLTTLARVGRDEGTRHRGSARDLLWPAGDPPFDPTGASTLADDALPDYEPMLASYHAAFALELEAMVGTLPIWPGDLVLEMACGDGAYTPWLAARVGPEGGVVGLDVSTGYLGVARGHLRRAEHASRSRFVAGSIERPPFADGTFDAIWCAQSLFSLPEPVDAVSRMARLVKPGGLVAVLENDTLHQVLLPWPVELELAVRLAEWEALREEVAHPRKFYVGRRLVGVFREAGLVDLRVRSFASSRVAPLDEATRTFLGAYLEDLSGQVLP
jgi:ubiquinone/menaquinone biosynthesis C-methylase UbiE